MSIHFNPGAMVKRGARTQAAASSVITRIYSTPGSFSDTIPSGATTATVEVWGGGGFAGDSWNAGGMCPYNSSGGAAGSGGYARTVVTVSGAGGGTFTGTVGAGATALATLPSAGDNNYPQLSSGAYGLNGGTSTVSTSAVSFTTITATGGIGGTGGGIYGAIGNTTTFTGYIAGTVFTLVSRPGGNFQPYNRLSATGLLLPTWIGLPNPTTDPWIEPLNVGEKFVVSQSQTLGSAGSPVTFQSFFQVGGYGGTATGGTAANTSGNVGARGFDIDLPVATTPAIVGLYGSPTGYGYGGGCTTANIPNSGGNGAVVIRYS